MSARSLKSIALASALLAAGCATPRPRLAQPAPSSAPWGPWSAPDQPALAPERAWPSGAGDAPRAHFVEAAYRLYRDHLTRIDGARCEHRPTCSRYAIESVRAHGALLGALLTVDRLMRGSSSSSLRSLPVIAVDQGRRLVSDPVYENDFFFAQPAP